MKFSFGICLILAGTIMIASALGLYSRNVREDEQAAEAVSSIMPLIVEQIHVRYEEMQKETVPLDATVPTAPVEEKPRIPEMPTAEINGYNYIGFVGIPTLQLELPVMADWSYPQLQIAPCRFTGNAYADDLVVMAHNYANHFGNLQNLRVGESITFTDMNGETVYYSVVALDILEPTAVEEMTAGEYDLTLFTCTYGGKTRVTVRCDRTEDS